MTGSERGFTIIEVMLFLAITGGLFAALMIGVNVGITQQRYLDSVRSFKALLQDQYSAAINTRNDNSQSWKCADANDGNVVPSGSASPRGTSDCVILGRAIQIKNGERIVTSSVTGYAPGALDNANADSAVLLSYHPKLALYDQQEQSMDWDSVLTAAENKADASRSTAVILILRSPVSGSIMVYTSGTELSNATDLASIIENTPPTGGTIVKSCVDGNSGLLPKQMIVVDPTSSGPDAVSTDGGNNEVCQR